MVTLIAILERRMNKIVVSILPLYWSQCAVGKDYQHYKHGGNLLKLDLGIILVTN